MSPQGHRERLDPEFVEKGERAECERSHKTRACKHVSRVEAEKDPEGKEVKAQVGHSGSGSAKVLLIIWRLGVGWLRRNWSFGSASASSLLGRKACLWRVDLDIMLLDARSSTEKCAGEYIERLIKSKGPARGRWLEKLRMYEPGAPDRLQLQPASSVGLLALFVGCLGGGTTASASEFGRNLDWWYAELKKQYIMQHFIVEAGVKIAVKRLT